MDEIFRLHCMRARRKSKQVKDVLDGFYIDPWLGSLNYVFLGVKCSCIHISPRIFYTTVST